ncbi:MAG: flagellar basal body P-ring protein FlgI [Desulfohalobiaceae bacterium]
MLLNKKGSTHRLGLAALCLGLLLLLGSQVGAESVRLKDIASFSGVRSNQLVGYGLVVGLSGTGDQRGAQFTVQSVANMLENMGVRVDKSELRPQNVAAVTVTSRMPASAQPGSTLDVAVSSIGDAESLQGGTLLMTPMKGIDGDVYALAQGQLTLGGFQAEGQAGETTQNSTTVARIPEGAVVERQVPFEFNTQQDMSINLDVQDFSTTQRVVEKINQVLGGDYSRAEDISSINLQIPDKFQGNLVPLMASLENLTVSPDSRAKVVVDEKTGTVVMGHNVRLSPAAVAQGNLQVTIEERPEVSQPAPFSPGETVVVPRTDIEVEEEDQRLTMLSGARLQELVDGLNAIGATPRDLISILRTLKSAGALHAELEVN